MMRGETQDQQALAWNIEKTTIRVIFIICTKFNLDSELATFNVSQPGERQLAYALTFASHIIRGEGVSVSQLAVFIYDSAAHTVICSLRASILTLLVVCTRRAHRSASAVPSNATYFYSRHFTTSYFSPNNVRYL